jgi:adenylate kinase family enzyme
MALMEGRTNLEYLCAVGGESCSLEIKRVRIARKWVILLRFPQNKNQAQIREETLLDRRAKANQTREIPETWLEFEKLFDRAWRGVLR